MDIILSILTYLLVFLASALIVQYGYKRNAIAIQLIGLAPVTILSAIRYDVGLDYIPYLHAYADIINNSPDPLYSGTPNLEPTFKFIASVANIAFGSPVGLFGIYGAVTVLFAFLAIKKMSFNRVDLPLFAFYSILFLNSFNTMRQGAAISIGMLALVYFASNKKTQAMIWSIVAVLFHSSAILLFVFMGIGWCLQKKKVWRKTRNRFKSIYRVSISLIAMLVVANLTIDGFSEWVYNSTGRIGDFTGLLSLGVILKTFLMVYCLCYLQRSWNNLNGQQKMLSFMFAAGTVVYSLGLIHNESARLGMYIFALFPIMFMIAHENINIKYPAQRLGMRVIITIACAMYVISVNFGTEKVRYVYQTVFSPGYSEQIGSIGL